MGKTDINRRHAKGKKVENELTSTMHMVSSIGKPGKALFRRRAHFGCAVCDRGDYKNCPERDRCGDPNERTIVVKTQNALSYAHMKQNRATLARTAKQGDYIVVECSGGCHTPPGVLPYDPDEYLFFDNANFVVGQVQKPVHEYDGDKVATPFGDKRSGDKMLTLLLLLPTSPGSSTFAPVGDDENPDVFSDVFDEDVVWVLSGNEFATPTGARNTRACPNGGKRRTMPADVKAKLLQLVMQETARMNPN